MLTKGKVYSRSADQNKEAILEVFEEVLPQTRLRLLEIGAGTAQHAVFIAARFPELQWVISDVAGRQLPLKKVLREAKLKNVHGPIVYEVGKDEFPKQKFDLVFASQLLHLLPWKDTKSLIKKLGNRLRKDSLVFFYGAFKYGGHFSTERFEEVDKAVKEHDPEAGIRAFEDVDRAMNKAGFSLVKDYEMPLSNRLLIYRRLEHKKKP